MAPIPAEGLIVLALFGAGWLCQRVKHRKTGECPWFDGACPHDEICPLWLRHCPGLESGVRDD